MHSRSATVASTCFNPCLAPAVQAALDWRRTSLGCSARRSSQQTLYGSNEPARERQQQKQHSFARQPAMPASASNHPVWVQPPRRQHPAPIAKIAAKGTTDDAASSPAAESASGEAATEGPALVDDAPATDGPRIGSVPSEACVRSIALDPPAHDKDDLKNRDRSQVSDRRLPNAQPQSSVNVTMQHDVGDGRPVESQTPLRGPHSGRVNDQHARPPPVVVSGTIQVGVHGATCGAGSGYAYGVTQGSLALHFVCVHALRTITVTPVARNVSFAPPSPSADDGQGVGDAIRQTEPQSESPWWDSMPLAWLAQVKQHGAVIAFTTAVGAIHFVALVDKASDASPAVEPHSPITSLRGRPVAPPLVPCIGTVPTRSGTFGEGDVGTVATTVGAPNTEQVRQRRTMSHTIPRQVHAPPRGILATASAPRRPISDAPRQAGARRLTPPARTHANMRRLGSSPAVTFGGTRRDKGCANKKAEDADICPKCLLRRRRRAHSRSVPCALPSTTAKDVAQMCASVQDDQCTSSPHTKADDSDSDHDDDDDNGAKSCKSKAKAMSALPPPDGDKQERSAKGKDCKECAVCRARRKAKSCEAADSEPARGGSDGSGGTRDVPLEHQQQPAPSMNIHITTSQVVIQQDQQQQQQNRGRFE